MNVHPRSATRHMNAEQRFWHYVEKSDDCWLWRGPVNKAGYGLLCVGGGNDVLAHRWSYEQHIAALDGLHACHKCDNPSCVNPDHLFPGDDAANHTDKAKKLRAGKVLTPEQVRKIKAEVQAGGSPLHLIAQQYGCSRKSIQRIKNGSYWVYA